ncbi:MAG: hypothetical protein HND48_25725 [Chloroflexi bacterium]|nr:hypothetical protein [Chloroflexota bacterium]
MTLTTYVDGLALLFALLVTGVGAVVAFYTANYFDDDADAQRFSVLFAVFMGSMLMVVTSGNLLMTFVGWEGTSIFSFLLIGFDGGQSGRKGDEARAGALRAFIVTGAGGLALIVGVVLLGTAAGSYELADVLAAPRPAQSRPVRRCRRADRAGGVHQVGAVPVPLLAARRDVRPQPGLGVSARGDNGQGRRVPTAAPSTGAG